MIDLEKLAQAYPELDPIRHVVVDGLVSEAGADELLEDFPDIDRHGSFPLEKLQYGPKFAELLDDLSSPQFAAIVGEKLDIDLAGRPVMITVRGVSDGKDGQIHVDNPNKLVTLLLYLGGTAGSETGRLRLLRSKKLEDYAVEIAPEFGTLLIFRNEPGAWHGFHAFSGTRRVIQVNWVTNEAYRQREHTRHSFSAILKSLFLGGAGRAHSDAA